MSDPATEIRAKELERQVLRVLCAGAPEGSSGSLQGRVRELVSGYHWHDPVHQALFEVLGSLPVTNSRVIREQLPARLARKGFPDVALDDLFEPLALWNQQVEKLIRQLTGERVG
ncbi:MAG TPA: hypothetical protein VGW33_00360 [Terriglobia bacterium]|nr:hypothetical protein [Terriglobia bacterium]